MVVTEPKGLKSVHLSPARLDKGTEGKGRTERPQPLIHMPPVRRGGWL